MILNEENLPNIKSRRRRSFIIIGWAWCCLLLLLKEWKGGRFQFKIKNWRFSRLFPWEFGSVSGQKCPCIGFRVTRPFPYLHLSPKGHILSFTHKQKECLFSLHPCVKEHDPSANILQQIGVPFSFHPSVKDHPQSFTTKATYFLVWMDLIPCVSGTFPSPYILVRIDPSLSKNFYASIWEEVLCLRKLILY